VSRAKLREFQGSKKHVMGLFDRLRILIGICMGRLIKNLEGDVRG
jgi:hypothetical protein